MNGTNKMTIYNETPEFDWKSSSTAATMIKNVFKVQTTTVTATFNIR